MHPCPKTVFDLTDALEDITGSAYLPGYQDVNFYASEIDMENGNPIANPNAYVNAQNPQDIYVEVSNINTENVCTSTALLSIEVLALPVVSITDPEDLLLTACDDNNDVIAADSFDLTLMGAMIAGGENVDVSYWKTEDAAENGNTDNNEYIADPENYVNEPEYNIPDESGVPTNVQIIYARVESGNAGNYCYIIVPFRLRIDLASEIGSS